MVTASLSTPRCSCRLSQEVLAGEVQLSSQDSQVQGGLREGPRALDKTAGVPAELRGCKVHLRTLAVPQTTVIRHIGQAE